MPVVGDAASRRDEPSVDRSGRSLAAGIAGVDCRWLVTQPDHRGELAELFRLDWGFHPEPVTTVVYVGVRPGAVKGWHLHETFDDRNLVVAGFTRWVLYDDREGSPTRGWLQVVTITERNRGLLFIPRGVWHAVQNLGTADAVLVNLPTEPYDHARPDKVRMPLVNDLIRFDFENRSG